MIPLLRWFTFSKWWLFMAMWLCLITKGNIDIMHPMLKNPSPVGYTSAVVVSLIWVRPKIRYPCFFQDLSSLLVVGSTEPHGGLCQPGWNNLFSPGLTLYGKDISIKQKKGLLLSVFKGTFTVVVSNYHQDTTLQTGFFDQEHHLPNGIEQDDTSSHLL
jgi:hypothetical protein